MDRDRSNRAADGHTQAETKLDRAENAIRAALEELKDVSGRLKARVAGEKKQGDFPIDDDPPGDTEEALQGGEARR